LATDYSPHQQAPLWSARCAYNLAGEWLLDGTEFPARDRGITTLLSINISDCDGHTQKNLTGG
jgi:hypothetical protein